MGNTELEIRRLYIEDEQWDRTSPTWKRLEPKRNFNRFDESDETISEYCLRVQAVISIPEPVAEQWLYAHYYNGNTVDNYGWIDYGNAVFMHTTITTDDAIKLRVINEYSEYVQDISKSVPFSGFCCTDQDQEYWLQKRTWRTPPVIANIKSFPKPPPYADFAGSYQLIEGHSRLGYLLAMNSSGKPLSEEHEVFILGAK